MTFNDEGDYYIIQPDRFKPYYDDKGRLLVNFTLLRKRDNNTYHISGKNIEYIDNDFNFDCSDIWTNYICYSYKFERNIEMNKVRIRRMKIEKIKLNKK